MDLWNDESSSSDEEVFDILDNIRARRHRLRLFRERNNPFEMPDEEFFMRYRLRKNTVTEILHIIGGALEGTTQRNGAISAVNKLLVALRFYATGSLQILVGDDLHIHKMSVCRIIKQVSQELAALRANYIFLPRNAEELAQVKNDFFGIRRFPCVLGCVDGTHIKIQSPGGEQGELFRNRKGYFSINVQIVCDANLKIRDIVARWPGSTHDSTIFNSSQLFALLENGEFQHTYLLGDSAYPCRQYLLTPILQPQTPSEQRYNEAHIHTRNTVERTFGVWKRRFQCLSTGMRTKLDTTLTIIVATAILHNIAQKNNDLPDDNIVEQINEEEEAFIFENQRQRFGVRQAIIDTYFTECKMLQTRNSVVSK